jgi:hypothetical protein
MCRAVARVFGALGKPKTVPGNTMTEQVRHYKYLAFNQRMIKNDDMKDKLHKYKHLCSILENINK